MWVHTASVVLCFFLALGCACWTITHARQSRPLAPVLHMVPVAWLVRCGHSCPQFRWALTCLCLFELLCF